MSINKLKKLFLSNSQINTFTDCEFKWYLDKVQKLRPNYLGSALWVGGAIDSATEAYLLEKSDIEKVFLDSLAKFEVNGKPKTLPKDILAVKLFASDLDEKLLTPLQETVNEYCESLDLEGVEIAAFLEYCKKKRKAKSALSESEQKIFNYMGYLSLQEKGKLIVKALKEWLDENVAETHYCQKKILIKNENGDSFIGYLDFVVTLKDGRKVLIDLKTSSDPAKYYPKESAAKSRQLGIYAQEEGIEDVGYLVADKKIRVREPRVRLSFVEGKITEEHLDEVFEEIETVTEKIKEKLQYGIGAFDKNLDSCNLFGGCPYAAYCHKGSKDELEQL